MPRAKRSKAAEAPTSPSSPPSEDISVSSSPPTIDPYTVLALDRSSTADQIRSSYRLHALRHHPDKVPEAERATAHVRFQEIAFAYAVLSDPARRARYDATGSTAESLGDGDDDFSWAEYFRQQFCDAISAETIARFAKEYKGSDEERRHVLAAYDEVDGDLEGVFERVMLCETSDDHDRVVAMIEAAIEAGDVDQLSKHTRQTKKSKARRAARAKAEETEAIAHAKDLGIHDKLFGNSKNKGQGDGDDGGAESGLAALIKARQKERNPDAFFDHLLDKYGPKGGKGGKKRSAAAAALENDTGEMDAEGVQMPPAAAKGRKKSRR